MDPFTATRGWMYDCRGNHVLAESFGLKIVKVAWEDPARDQFSVWGRCIADMSLASRGELMPVVRKPNYYDPTADWGIDNFTVAVGNHQGFPLTSIPLREYLARLDQYAGAPSGVNLLADRDSQV